MLFRSNATITDILYIVASKMATDKHVDITRYPMDNPNGQNPFRIIISTTMRTTPVTIGDVVYEHFPVCEGDPRNAFMVTGQISNVMADRMGMDLTETYLNEVQISGNIDQATL